MRGALVSLRAGRQPSPRFGGGNALESGPLHRAIVGVHRDDSHGGDVLGRHAERDQGRLGQATWRRWLQELVLLLLVFGAALVGTSGDFRTEQPAFRPEAIETASRLLGALVVVAAVYSYAFLRGWPRWTLPP
jgi:hypothetical protein